MHFPTKNIGGNFLCGKLGGGGAEVGLSGGQTFSRYSFLNDSLSLTKYCNLNVVCPDLSHLDHHVCARPQGVLEICAIIQLKNVPTLPPLPHPLPPRSLSNDMSCDNLSLLITSSSSSSLSPSSSTLAPKTSQYLILLFYPTPTTSFLSFSLGPFQSLIISPPRVLGPNLIPLLLPPSAPPAHLHMSIILI